MNLNELLDEPSKLDTLRTRVFAAILGEAIQSLHSVPSGELYARVMGHMTLEQYNAAIDKLLSDKKITRASHLLTWVA